MKNKKIPLRTCAVTNEKLPKAELLRIVKAPDGSVVVDETGKLNGRGAYIKRDMAVVEKAIKEKSLERKLEVTISNEIFETIKDIINN